ncbi:plasmid replication protein, CyRepA1 family [Parasphingorhabdus sp.]|uniref:plasmid replication protein, CyRepA1 family n=1 Tax=Parasphingorhabdus sp. TaxID=2709688 RepID=UPI003A90F97C
MSDLLKARDALSWIDPNTDRDTWIEIGMAAHAAGLSFDDFDAWSSAGQGYKQATCRAVWRSFKNGRGFTAATLFWHAKQAGWRDTAPRDERPVFAPAPTQADNAEREAEQAQAAKRARWAWDNAGPADPSHPYLILKGITAPVGIRQEASGALLVPMHDAMTAELVNVQRIHADGAKRFLKGGAKHGTCMMLPGIGPRVFVEGYATGCTVSEATGRPVVVCFDAGNLEAIAKRIGQPGDVIAADNDNAAKPEKHYRLAHDKYGTGHKAAMRAGLPFYLPTVAGKDFNDIGTDATRAIFDAAPVSDLSMFKAWGLKPAELKGTNSERWGSQLAKAETPEQAASMAWAIASRLAHAAPVAHSIAGIRELLESSAPTLLHPATLDSIADRLAAAMRYREADALAPVTISDAAKARHRVERVKQLTSLTPAECRGVIVVKAPMASGKTQNIGRPLAEWAMSNGHRFMAVCHRRSLVSELHRRLYRPDGWMHYESVTHRDQAHSAPGIAVCLPSIIKPTLAPVVDDTRVVFIDEISQAIDFLENDALFSTGGGSAQAAFDRLRAVVAQAECVVVADAGVNDRVIEFLEAARPGEQFRIIEQVAKRPGIEARISFGKNDGPANVVGDALAELGAGGKVWLSCESSKRAAAIGQLFDAYGYRVMAVTADNQNNAAQAAFLANAEDESRQYDVVVASPVISSGISVEHRDAPHFTLGAFIGAGGAIAPSDAAQMLRRVRYLKRYTIGMYPNNRTGNQHPDAILQAAAQAARIEGDRVSQATDYDALVAAVRAEHENVRADFAAGLVWQLKAAGWQLEAHDGTAQDSIVAELKLHRTALDDRHHAALKAAPVLSDDAADALKRNQSRTDLQSITLEAHIIRRALGMVGQPLTDDAIDWWDDGRAVRRMDRFDAWRGVVPSRNAEGVPVTQRKYLEAAARAYVWLFDGFDIDAADWLTAEAAGVIVERIMQHRHLLAHLGIVSRKFAAWNQDGKTGEIRPMKWPAYPVREVTDVLARMGLEVKANRRRCDTSGVSSNRKHAHVSHPSTSTKGNPIVRIYSVKPDSLTAMTAWCDQRNAARRVQTVAARPLGNRVAQVGDAIRHPSVPVIGSVLARHREMLASSQGHRHGTASG